MKKLGSSENGITLIEVMFIVVILGILMALAIPRFLPPSDQTKMAEAKQILKQVYVMQQPYLQAHGHYWDCPLKATAGYPHTYDQIGVILPENARYFYQMWTSPDGLEFTCRATANLDPDSTLDIWLINQNGELSHQSDDTAD